MAEVHLVTGATGCVGSNLARYLVSQGKRVRVFVRDEVRFRNLLPDLEVEVALGDMTDASSVRKAVEGATVVYHNAFVLPGVRGWSRERSQWVNRKGMYNVLEAALEAEAQVVFASTQMVYGPPRYVPMDEGHPLGGKGAYAQDKIACEAMCWRYAEKGLRVTVLRLAAVYGPGMTYKPTLSIFKDIARGRPLFLPGGGHRRLDFVHVDDVARAMLSAAGNERAYGEAFNVVGSGPIRFCDLARQAKEVAGSRSPLIPVPFLMARLLALTDPSLEDVLYFFQRDVVMDGRKAAEYLHYRPCVGYEEGLRSVFRWLEVIP